MSFWDSLRSFGNSLPLVGGATQAIWGDPAQEAHQGNIEASQRAIREQRAANMRARMNAMKQGALAFTPINQLIGEMYGQGAMLDIGAMTKNPMPQYKINHIDEMAGYGTTQPPVPAPPQQLPAQFRPGYGNNRRQ